MILITGAGGKTGIAVIKALSGVEKVYALAYRREHAGVLQAAGVEKIVAGDLRDGAVVRAAMEGVRSVYHICPNMSPDELAIGRLVVEEAHRAGVGHFVYHSVLHPQTEKMGHHWQKLRVEELLLESRLPFTILQPAPYMQNLLNGWQRIVTGGVLRVPYSVEAKFSFVDLEDLAQAVQVVLTQPGHQNATYELAGTPPLSHVELAQSFTRVLATAVRAEKMEIGDWQRGAEQSGMSAYAIENLIRMFEYYDRWGLVGNPNVLRWLLRREPVSWDAFLERSVRALDEPQD